MMLMRNLLTAACLVIAMHGCASVNVDDVTVQQKPGEAKLQSKLDGAVKIGTVTLKKQELTLLTPISAVDVLDEPTLVEALKKSLKNFGFLSSDVTSERFVLNTHVVKFHVQNRGVFTPAVAEMITGYELRNLESGATVAKFSVASTGEYKSFGGARRFRKSGEFALKSNLEKMLSKLRLLKLK